MSHGKYFLNYRFLPLILFISIIHMSCEDDVANNGSNNDDYFINATFDGNSIELPDFLETGIGESIDMGWHEFEVGFKFYNSDTEESLEISVIDYQDVEVLDPQDSYNWLAPGDIDYKSCTTPGGVVTLCNGIEIVYKDSDDAYWFSYISSVPANNSTSSFTITERGELRENMFGEKYTTVRGTFNCILYKNSNPSDFITIEDGSFYAKVFVFLN